MGSTYKFGGALNNDAEQFWPKQNRAARSSSVTFEQKHGSLGFKFSSALFHVR